MTREAPAVGGVPGGIVTVPCPSNHSHIAYMFLFFVNLRESGLHPRVFRHDRVSIGGICRGTYRRCLSKVFIGRIYRRYFSGVSIGGIYRRWLLGVSIGGVYRVYISEAPIGPIYGKCLSAASIEGIYRRCLSGVSIGGVYWRYQSRCSPEVSM